ncbi:MAG: hypothetical protein FVQ79_03400 [Planctomycetes bacterium]|nr:hypothetical protein [Planctomycetota bacterium]
MSEGKRAQISKIVDHFRSNKPSGRDLEKYCKQMRFEFVTPNELEDYTVQVEHDEKVFSLFPLLIKEAQKLSYVPEFADEDTRKKLLEQNEEVRIAMAKLFEFHKITYRLVTTLGVELASIVGGAIEAGGTTVFNKALDVLLHVARDKFGGEFNTGHAAKYAEEVIQAAVDKNKNGEKK